MTSSYRNHYNYLFRFIYFIRFSMSMLLSFLRKVTKETLTLFVSVYSELLFLFGNGNLPWWR